MSKEPGGPDEEWLSIAQAAERLASSRRVVTLWARTGKLGEVKPGQTGRGKGMRVSRRSVEARVAERAVELERRVAREAERKARLEQAYNGRVPVISKRNLNWMLDLLGTLSDIADESLQVEHASTADARDARKVMAGISDTLAALQRLRDRRFSDMAGEEGGEG